MSEAMYLCVFIPGGQVLLIFNQSNHRELPGAIFVGTSDNDLGGGHPRRSRLWRYLLYTTLL